MRVIKGYHAEEREASVFSAGVERLLHNVMKSLTMTSVLGVGLHDGARAGFGAGDVARRPSRSRRTRGPSATTSRYNMFLAFMIAPVFQMVNIGTQLTEAFAGLDRTNEIMAELEENQIPGAHGQDAAHRGHGAL